MIRRLAVPLLAMVLGGLGACGTAPTSETKGTPSAMAGSGAPPVASGSAGKSVPGRASWVLQADQLAAQALGLPPAKAVPLIIKAARLRELAYQAEGKQTDLLEALELWTDASSQEGADSCVAGLGLIELRAHMTKELSREYKDLYLARGKTKSADCRQRLERALAILAPYAPTQGELAALGKGEGEAGPIVVPELLEKSLSEPTRITKIEPFGSEQTARVVIAVTHPTKFQVGVLEPTASQGPRLFVDIDKASYAGPALFEQKGLVQKVRAGKNAGGMRVVLDLERVAHHRVFYLPEPFRLVIDLSVEATEGKSFSRELRRIVLDPGHGGSDPGAVGPSGLREKDVTLDVAHRAAPLLAREVGVSTLLTRDVDVYVGLDERAARANAFHSDLFISIHMNSSENTASRGVMTFVLDSSRDTTAAEVAARENSSSEAAAAELANSLSRIESADRRAASHHFADLLQKAAGASLRQRFNEIEDHGVRKAGFYVLAGAAMPAVLFEGSFISNPLEERRLNSDAYRQHLADAIVNAVRAYREGL